MAARFGLVGTGAWAASVHAPALQSDPGVELVGVWGRDPAKTAEFARDHALNAYPDLDALIRDVDAIAVAVSPSAQPRIAVRAARAGKHLILEKPIGRDAADAREVARAVEQSGVHALVFLSRLWDGARREWLLDQAHQGRDIRYVWNSAGMLPGSQGEAGWRQESGPLLDVGPHMLPILEMLAGPIVEVGELEENGRARVALSVMHQSGTRSQLDIDLTKNVPFTEETITAQGGTDLAVWANDRAVDFGLGYAAMLGELLTQIDGVEPIGARAALASVPAFQRTATVMDLSVSGGGTLGG